jgi:hypothetical protein
MEKQFTQPGPVLDAKGRPFAGYSTGSVLAYDRRAIKAPPWRIKEWDFYQVTDATHCLQFTIGHAAYAGQVSVMLFDFANGEKLAEKNRFLVLPFGSLKMPENTEKDHTLAYSKGGMEMRFECAGDIKLLSCRSEDFSAEITLTRRNPNSLVISIPFDESPRAFYYNQKINCMEASGFVRWGGGEHRFLPGESYGLLDWGRGVWPFHNEWYWSNGTGIAAGELFGFNLGCGFGNTSQATENMLFCKGEAHKLGTVRFELGESYMAPWRIRDEEGRLDLTLKPVYDRTTKTKLLWVDNCCHQMFGAFSGKAVLDDGTELRIENLISFAEHSVNNW